MLETGLVLGGYMYYLMMENFNCMPSYILNIHHIWYVCNHTKEHKNTQISTQLRWCIVISWVTQVVFNSVTKNMVFEGFFCILSILFLLQAISHTLNGKKCWILIKVCPAKLINFINIMHTTLKIFQVTELKRAFWCKISKTSTDL